MKRRMGLHTAWLVAGTLSLSSLSSLSSVSGQLLPPPKDGDIRAVYWELRNESEVWLTLEPKAATGGSAPMLTFTFQFPGKRPAVPPAQIEVRAYAPVLMWAPRPELWLVLDGGDKLDIGARGSPYGMISGQASDYLTAMISIDTLKRIAGAKRIAGSALGIDFELNESQASALRTFLERVLSDNPVRWPR